MKLLETIKIFPKAIKILPEYGCFPIWLNNIEEIDEILNIDDYHFNKEELIKYLPNIKTEWLSISQILIDKITTWNTIFQNSFINTEYEFCFQFNSKRQEEWFYKEKYNICNKLIIELPNTKIFW